MSANRTNTTRVTVHWAVIVELPGFRDVFEYDDEETARAHLPDYEGGYLAWCKITQEPWQKLDL